MSGSLVAQGPILEIRNRCPLSTERLEIDKSGQVILKLKTAYSDGTSALLFTPGEFIEKLQVMSFLPQSSIWSSGAGSLHRVHLTAKS